MNLIGNDCVSACFYAISKKQFNNPFTWAICNYPHMLYVITHYKNINWKRYSIHTSTAAENTYKVTVDGKINLHYVHHRKIKEFTKEYTEKGNVYSNNIELKVIELYAKRVYRMLEEKENPVFILNTYDDHRHQYSLDNVKSLCKLKLPYPIILITPYDELKKYQSKMLHVIIDKTKDGQLIRCNRLYNKIKNIITNELNLKI